MHSPCPGCRRPTSPGDIDPALNIVRCSACGFAWPASAPTITPEASPLLDLTHPPDGASYTTHTGLRRVSAPIRNSLGWFLLLFGLIWGGAFCGGIYIPQILKGSFDLTNALIGLPFILITGVFILFAAIQLRGESTAELRGSTLTLRTGLGPFAWSTTLDTATIRDIRLADAPRQGKKRGVHAILIITDRTITFGASLDTDRRAFLFAALTKFLRSATSPE